MYNEHRSWALFFFRIVEIIFTINIILLDVVVFHNFVSATATTVPVATQQRPVLPTSTPTTAAIISPNPTTTTTTIINQTTGAKEVFIPIGQGQVTATDWTTVPGAAVTIDSTKYTHIQHIVFEASIQSPNNQLISVRLYDATDGHPVWYSDMSTSSTTQLITSQPIQLDSGTKLYEVQMKSQLQYPAILEQARLHITLQ